MKTRKFLFRFAAAVFAAAIFFACKKQESREMPPPSVNNAAVRNAVQKLQESFQQTATAESKQTLARHISNIDYSTTAEVPLPGGNILYLAKLLTNGKTKTDKFLTVLKDNNGYSFGGLYEGKGLPMITMLLTSNTLPSNGFVSVKNLNSVPVKAWKEVNGKIQALIAKSITKAKLQQTMLRLSSKNPRLFLEDNGGGGGSECIEYWWWIWEPEFGEWIPLYYLYTICGTGGSNGMGGGGDEGACLEEAQGISDNLTGADASEDVSETVTSLGVDSAEILRKWKCVDNLTFSFISKEIGKTKLINPQYGIWDWISLTHHSIEAQGMIIGGTSSVNAAGVVAIPHIQNLNAWMTLDFSVVNQPHDVTCNGVTIKLPSYSVPHNPTSPHWLAKGQ